MPRLALLAVLALVLSACDGTEPRPPRVIPPSAEFPVIYRVEPTATLGAPRVDAIRYTGADGRVGTLTNVTLPWTLTVMAPRAEGRLYTLESEVNTGGNVTGMIATIFVEGQSVSQGIVAGQSGGLNQTRTARAAYLHRP